MKALFTKIYKPLRWLFNFTWKSSIVVLTVIAALVFSEVILGVDVDELFSSPWGYDTMLNDNDEQEYLEERNKQATARLRAYAAGDGYEGLMTPEGHVITIPLYENIEAIGPDTYLCTVSDCDKVVVNGKGEVVR